jgi:CO/xanthine dehydrogenase Mo-binding subunit
MAAPWSKAISTTIVLRINEMPAIEVSGAKHRSARRISEPGAASALTNPIFVATGKWIRELSIKD